MQETGIWRRGVKPPDGIAPPFPVSAMIARMERCAVIVVRVEPRDADEARKATH